MPQTLTPTTSLDRGVGIANLDTNGVVSTDLEVNFANDGNSILAIVNGSASTLVVTLNAQPDPFGRGGGGTNDEAISIPAGETGLFPFMSPVMFNNGGITSLTLDAVDAAVKLNLIRLTKRV